MSRLTRRSFIRKSAAGIATVGGTAAVTGTAAGDSFDYVLEMWNTHDSLDGFVDFRQSPNDDYFYSGEGDYTIIDEVGGVYRDFLIDVPNGVSYWSPDMLHVYADEVGVIDSNNVDYQIVEL